MKAMINEAERVTQWMGLKTMFGLIGKRKYYGYVYACLLKSIKVMKSKQHNIEKLSTLRGSVEFMDGVKMCQDILKE